MFAREGFLIIAIALMMGAALASLSWFLPPGWNLMILVLAVAVVAFTLYFFRDPLRTPPEEAAEGRLVLAPADGKVVVVDRDVHESIYLEGPAQQISIFLSPLNVHVNRVPADGVIEHENYVPGEYLVAWHPKASEKNERSELGLRHPSGARILFKQIAGAMARRIVYHLEEGDEVVAGERFGIVKFGSRMDVFLPQGVSIEVDVNDRVRAGVTILARLPEEAAEREDERPASADRRS